MCECGRWSRKWITGADGNENSASGWSNETVYWFYCISLNCADKCTCSSDATDCTALYTKHTISLCNISLEKCEPSEAQWLLYVPPVLTFVGSVVAHTVRLWVLWGSWNKQRLSEILSFRSHVVEVLIIAGYLEESVGNLLPIFREWNSVP
jgi:hypothetical protein